MRVLPLLFWGQMQCPDPGELFGIAGGTCRVLYSFSVQSHLLNKLQDSTPVFNAFISELSKMHKHHPKLIPLT